MAVPNLPFVEMNQLYMLGSDGNFGTVLHGEEPGGGDTDSNALGHLEMPDAAATDFRGRIRHAADVYELSVYAWRRAAQPGAPTVTRSDYAACAGDQTEPVDRRPEPESKQYGGFAVGRPVDEVPEQIPIYGGQWQQRLADLGLTRPTPTGLPYSDSTCMPATGVVYLRSRK